MLEISYSDIDLELNTRMRATWDMCELGRRVRSELKIRNRQPLKKAYVLFNNKKVQDYILYCDRYDEYLEMIADELNVFDVQVIDNHSSHKFCNIELKPNFRVLGQKGFGKQANLLKQDFADLSFEERNFFLENLQQSQSTDIAGITISLDDIIVEYIPKEGFASASDKVGVVILDTTLDDNLLEYGFISDFRSFIQNARKDANLKLTDRIQLEIECDASKQIILNKEKFNFRLRKELLLSGLDFIKMDNVVKNKAHEFIFNNDVIRVLMYVDNE